MSQTSSNLRTTQRMPAVGELTKKRILACEDGTWQDADSAVTTPSNVARLFRSVPPMGVDRETGRPIHQVVYYQNGVGTGSSGWYQRNIGAAINGATGGGLVSNVRETYVFICKNYNPGDDIILIGFSRGAFTARTVATLIKQLGLLTPKGLQYVTEIVNDWEYQLVPDHITPYPDRPWPNRPSFSTEEYRQKLIEHGLTRPNIPIKCVAVWDTVGSLGIPASIFSIAVHRLLDRCLPTGVRNLWPRPAPRELAFVDTAVLDNIEYAFHALALDEKRESFTPTIWYKPEGQELPTLLHQVWFPGVHSDIGGSYPNNDAADITLSWMVGHLDRHGLVTFDLDHILGLIKGTIRHHQQSASLLHNQNKFVAQEAKAFGTLKHWATGTIHESYGGIFKLGGLVRRTPRQYTRTTKDEGTTDDVLHNTFECMHLSTRVRVQLDGQNDTNNGLYKHSKPVQEWTWKSDNSSSSMTTTSAPSFTAICAETNVKWTKAVSMNGTSRIVAEMPEDHLTEFEQEVVRRWAAAVDGKEAFGADLDM